MNTEKATPDLLAALAAAQGEIENATKNAKNPHFKNNYADLAECLNTIRPVFSAHGLAVIQSAGHFDGAMVTVTTIITHKTGGMISSESTCVPAKTDAQGIGAATTYLRRYSVAAMCGIAQEDDDGQTSIHNSKPAAPKVMPSNLTIGEAEFSELNRLLDETDSNKEAFCKHFGIGSVAALPMNRYASAVSMLQKKAVKNEHK